MYFYTALTIKFFLLNSYRTTARRNSWPRVLKLMAAGGLTLGGRGNVEKTMIFTKPLECFFSRPY